MRCPEAPSAKSRGPLASSLLCLCFPSSFPPTAGYRQNQLGQYALQQAILHRHCRDCILRLFRHLSFHCIQRFKTTECLWTGCSVQRWSTCTTIDASGVFRTRCIFPLLCTTCEGMILPVPKLIVTFGYVNDPNIYPSRHPRSPHSQTSLTVRRPRQY